jgi:dTDP-glucose 4,6-dehydratase
VDRGAGRTYWWPVSPTRSLPRNTAFDDARAVVLGGAGFLGGHLVHALIDSGAEVVAVDNLSTGRDLLGVLDHPSVTFIRHDIVERFDVDGSADFVFHLASAASPQDYASQPVETLLANSVGTANALELAAAKSARVVLASTSEVYGDPLVHPQPETYWGNVNPIGPRSVYDEGKRFAEALAIASRDARGVDVRIARIFNTYGPGMRLDDGRAVPSFFAAALADEPLEVHGDGRQTRSLCYVDDLIDGILALAASDVQGPVNLGSGREVTILELAETVLRMCGGASRIEMVARPVDDPSIRRPDLGLAQEALGWKPEISLEEGLALCLPWFKIAVAAASAAAAGREEKTA